MWFTNRECDYKNEMWYYLIAFAVLIANVSILLRQLLGIVEIDMISIVTGTVLSVGILFAIVTFTIKLYTGGCFGINEWWLMFAIMNYPLMLIINEMTYEVAAPIAMFPFFFMYPAITIKSSGKEAAEASIIAFSITIAISVISYVIVTSSEWWINYGIVFTSAPVLEKIYRYTLGGFMLSGILAVFIALLPIGIGDYVLPGYYIWRYRRTAIIAAIMYAVILYILIYGGILRAIVNVGYREFAIA